MLTSCADVGVNAVKRVDVWYAWTPAFDDLTCQRFEGVLSPDERARCARFVFERDRHAFVIAHGLMRFALSGSGPYQPAEWQFETDTRGKPFVAGRQRGTPALSISLTHIRGLVACAVGRGMRLGIDVEAVGRVLDARDIALHHFAPSEVRALEASEPTRYPFRFVEMWTLKEAYVKGIGVGLECPLNAFAVRFDSDGGVALTGHGLEDGWKFLLAAPSPTTRLALAMSAERPAGRYEVTLRNVHGPVHGPVVPLRWSDGVTVRGDRDRVSPDEPGTTRSTGHGAHA